MTCCSLSSIIIEKCHITISNVFPRSYGYLSNMLSSSCGDFPELKILSARKTFQESPLFSERMLVTILKQYGLVDLLNCSCNPYSKCWCEGGPFTLDYLSTPSADPCFPIGEGMYVWAKKNHSGSCQAKGISFLVNLCS